jgi:hypothetical protein
MKVHSNEIHAGFFIVTDIAQLLALLAVRMKCVVRPCHDATDLADYEG